MTNRELDEVQREALYVLLALSANEAVSRCCQSCFVVVAEYATCITRDSALRCRTALSYSLP